MSRSRPSVPRPLRRLSLLAAVLAAAPFARADGDGRVVVVAPNPGQTPVPIAPDEKVAGATAVTVAGQPLVVVRVEKMPPKPDFNIITPDGVSHPYKNGASGVDGITVVHEPVVVQDATGKTWYRVVSRYTKDGRQVACGKTDYPCGSQLVPDPPQPPGLAFLCPDAEPATAEQEAGTLDALGVADTADTQVWWIPSGEMLLMHDASPAPITLVFGVEPLASDPPAPAPGQSPSSTPGESGETAPGEQNAGGSAEPAAPTGPSDPPLTTVPPDSATSGGPVDNDDAEVVFSLGESPDAIDNEAVQPDAGAAGGDDASSSSDASTSEGDRTDGSDAEGVLAPALDPCGFGVLTALPLCVLGLGASRGALRRRAA